MKSRRRREKILEILKIIRAFLEILMRFLGNSILEILKSFWKLFLEILKTKKKVCYKLGCECMSRICPCTPSSSRPPHAHRQGRELANCCDQKPLRPPKPPPPPPTAHLAVALVEEATLEVHRRPHHF